MDVKLRQFFHIVLDVFCIGSNHGAVKMVSCLGGLISLIRNAGIENLPDSLFNKPGNVTVNQLSRIAFGFAGNGFNAQLVYLFRGLRGQYHAKAQFPEEYGPKRKVFIHVQYPGDSDDPSFGNIRSQGFIVKHPVVLVVKQIGDLFSGLFLSQAPFTAVAADILPAAFKPVDSQYTMVGAAFAASHRGLVLQGNNLL